MRPKIPHGMNWLGLESRLRSIIRDALTEQDPRAYELAVHRIDAAIGAYTRRGEECGDLLSLDIPTREARDEEWLSEEASR